MQGDVKINVESLRIFSLLHTIDGHHASQKADAIYRLIETNPADSDLQSDAKRFFREKKAQYQSDKTKFIVYEYEQA